MTIKTHGRMVTDNTVGIPQLAVTDGTSGQAIVTDGSGTMTFATVGAGGAVGSSVYIENLFTGDGTTTTFTLSTGAPYEESILTFIDGVAQPTTSFTLPSTTSITFSPAPGNGAAIRVVHLGIASSVADNSITGAKLSMGGDAAGDILYYNGTDYQKLGIGTTGQHLATNSAVNAPEWVTPPTSGSIVQMKSVVYSTANSTTQTYGSGTTSGIRGNTAPTITQGEEIFTLSFTPTSTSNYLRIFVSVLVDAYPDAIVPMVCLHRDAISNALQTSNHKTWHAGDATPLNLHHIMQVPSTSAQTYRIRVGQSGHTTTGTVYINQNFSQGNLWGGIAQSIMTIEEYVP
jgi:hypothetical protein